MLSLTFYGGANGIGGNKILLEDGDSRLFFDFGTDFAQRYHYFEEYLNPRPGLGLLDFLEMGLLPPLEGIYRRDLDPDGSILASYTSSPLYREVDVEGVLLSHAHLDHSGYISFLKGDIPIYSSAMTAFVAKAVQDSGKGDMEKEVCYLTPREHVFPKLGKDKQDGEGALRAANSKKVNARQRPFYLFDCNELTPGARRFWADTPGARDLDSRSPTPVEGIGPLRLRNFPLDHSVPGACAYAVETSLGWVVYTGDLRWHGRQGQLTRDFVQSASQLRPAVLIGEGTNAPQDADAPPGPCFTEEAVFAKALEAVRGTRGLVIADFGARNVERLLTFRETAGLTGRRLVILARDAYLLEAMGYLTPSIPNIAQDPLLAIYHDSKSNLDRWERGIRERHRAKLVTPQQIHQMQGDYVLCFSFFDINELPQVRPKEGSAYIYSSSEAHNEEQEMDVRRLQNWLRHFDIRGIGLPVKGEIPVEERGLHASGHASAAELVELIRGIHPRVFVPVHTENADYFVSGLAGSGIQVRVPQWGERMEFRQ